MRHWYSMKKVEDDEEEDEDKKKNPFAEILIYDAIGSSFMGEQTVSAKSFIDGLSALGDVKEIKLRINSPGGDVFDGVAIYNAIKNHPAAVTAHVDGLAASAASFVAMAADRIVMPSNSFMLVHNAAGFAMGGADDMRAIAADLDRIDKSMTATYAARTGMSAAKVRALMKEDRLMDASEAKELGFTDEVSKPVRLTAHFSLHLLPRAAAARFRTATGAMQGEPPQSASATQGQSGVPTVPPDQPKHEPGTNEPRLPPDPFHVPGQQNPPPEPPPVQPVPPPPQSPQTPGQPQPLTPNQPDPPERPAPPPQTAMVIQLKQQGIEEHRAYVSAVTDLCTLARMADRVGGYVRASTSLDDIRKDLLTQVAASPVLSQHPLLPPKEPTAAWSKITDKLNARMK